MRRLDDEVSLGIDVLALGLRWCSPEHVDNSLSLAQLTNDGVSKFLPALLLVRVGFALSNGKAGV